MKIFASIRKKLASRGGYSLVELVVTFALVAIFSVAVLYVITSSMSVYTASAERASARAVSETLLEKVAGEIVGAQPGTRGEFGITVSDGSSGTNLLDFGAGECISLSTRTGSQIYITSIDGRLVIHYRPVDFNNRHLDAVDWGFDNAVYKGYEITRLSFEILENDGDLTNIIRVSMTLRSESGGYEYEASRCVQCFNFNDVASRAKISIGPIKADGAI